MARHRRRGSRKDASASGAEVVGLLTALVVLVTAIVRLL
jgi:hypothetical protein